MLKDFLAFQISKEFYWACKGLKLPRFLQEQVVRASSSVALNIAEGSGKRTPRDQARYYSQALGSLRECQAIFALEKIEDGSLLLTADKLGAILFKLSHMHATNVVVPTEDRNRTETQTQTATIQPNSEPTSGSN